MDIARIATTRLIDREVTEAIWKWIEDPRILVLVGARQVGKTSLLYLLIQRLIASGVSPSSIFYFDLEDFEILELFDSGIRDFIRYLEAEGMPKEKRTYVFVDEIQYMENPSNFLKLIADHHRNLKLICSGSSTLEIHRKFTDSLAGRKVVFEISTLTFREYLRFRNEEKLTRLLRNLPFESNVWEPPLEIHRRQLQAHYEQYLMYGGYPAVALEDDHERKLYLLREIYDSYVRKDINQLFTIENLMAFNNLVRLLAFQIGNLVNLQELTASLSISRPTLQKYLSVLENTFILKLIPPFFSNKRKEIVKMPKLYYQDMGMRNQAARQFQSLEARSDLGALVENAVFKALLTRLSPLQELKFWRTKGRSEVDFIIEGECLHAVEVKYVSMRTPRIPSGLRSFIQRYHPKTAVVVTRDFMGEAAIQGSRIHFIPACLLA